MRLQVSLEVDPGRFHEDELAAVGAEVLQRHHMGWLSLEVDAQRMQELRGLAGVDGYAPVLACEDRLETLHPAPEWAEVAAGESPGLLRGTLEAGRVAGRIAVLRQSISTLDKCFVRSHRTKAQDIVVAGMGPDGRERVACRYSDGLRDRSLAGMHDWPPGHSAAVALWVGHLPAGVYVVHGGVDGLIRVKSRLVPFRLEGRVQLG